MGNSLNCGRVSVNKASLVNEVSVFSHSMENPGKTDGKHFFFQLFVCLCPYLRKNCLRVELFMKLINKKINDDYFVLDVFLQRIVDKYCGVLL